MKMLFVMIWVVMMALGVSQAKAQSDGSTPDPLPSEAPTSAPAQEPTAIAPTTVPPTAPVVESALTPAILRKFSISAGAAYVDYREPDLMDEIGLLEGVQLSYRTRNETGSALYRIDAGYLMGHLTYDGGDATKGTRFQRRAADSLINIRGTISATYGNLGDWAILPFVGLGYRLLTDKIEGDGSYLRQISYLYLPLGGELSRTLASGSSLALLADFDIMFAGIVKNQLSDLDPSNSDVTMTNSGYGYHVEATYTLALDSFSVHVQPYYQRWTIAESTRVPVILNGNPNYVLYEPRNTSDLIGLNIGADF